MSLFLQCDTDAGDSLVSKDTADGRRQFGLQSQTLSQETVWSPKYVPAILLHEIKTTIGLRFGHSTMVVGASSLHCCCKSYFNHHNFWIEQIQIHSTHRHLQHHYYNYNAGHQEIIRAST